MLVGEIVTLFETGTSWWWVAIGITSVLVIWAIEQERAELATVAVIVATAAIMLLSDAWNYASVWLSPKRVVIGVLGYVAIGVAWGLIRWCWLVYQRRRLYDRLRREWLKRKHEAGVIEGELPTEVPESLRGEWTAYVKQQPGLDDYAWSSFETQVVPSPFDEKNRQRIAGWMAYWPWSMAWQLVRLLCERIWRWLVEQLAQLLKKLTEMIFPQPTDLEQKK